MWPTATPHELASQPGDVYEIHSKAQDAESDKHRWVIVNLQGSHPSSRVLMVPIALNAILMESSEFIVSVMGKKTMGLAICNHLHSFNLQNDIQSQKAHYIETLDRSVVVEIRQRVLNFIGN